MRHTCASRAICRKICSHRRLALAVDPYREDLKEEFASERYFARDFEGVAAAARQTLVTDPNNLGEHVSLCMSLEQLHRPAESFAECRQALVLQGQPDWGIVCAGIPAARVEGREPADCRQAIAGHSEKSSPRPVGLSQRLHGRRQERRNLADAVPWSDDARTRTVADSRGPRLRCDP